MLKTPASLLFTALLTACGGTTEKPVAPGTVAHPQHDDGGDAEMDGDEARPVGKVAKPADGQDGTRLPAPNTDINGEEADDDE